jgi:hypothetical protein
VLYTWVDKQGVTHYSQNSDGKGQRVEYDGSGITPMAPVVADFAPLSTPAPAAGAGGEHKGSAALHDIRRELEENQIKMQAARDAQAGI